MKIVSWNVNGLQAVIKKDFERIIKELNADIICVQETKISEKLRNFKLEGYYEYYNFAIKKGYSGVAIFSKEKAENVLYGMEINEYGEIENRDNEARVITLEYNSFYVVNVYVPSSQLNNQRKLYRLEFDYNFIKYIESLNNKKDVVICGDFNICHRSIDVCNREKHKFTAMFSNEEKANFEELLNIGFIDSYRYMHPQMRSYTFYTHDIQDRDNSNFGWRLDYILVSEYMRKNIREANILTNVSGSDHLPIEIILKV